MQSCPSTGSSLLVWLPGTCQDKTCFFQTNLLQAHPVLPGEQLPAPPSHRPQPHMATLHGSHHGAHTGHRPALPAQLLLHRQGQAGVPSTAPQLPQPHRRAEHRAEPVCAGSVAQHGTAQQGTTPGWLSRWVPASCPAQQVPHLLEPPGPWPAVMGACGEATSTPVTAAGWARERSQLPKPRHPPRPASPGRDGLCWPAAAGSSHLLAAQPWVAPPHGTAARAWPVPAAGGVCRATGGCNQPPPTCYSSAWPCTLPDVLPWPLPGAAPGILGPSSWQVPAVGLRAVRS